MEWLYLLISCSSCAKESVGGTYFKMEWCDVFKKGVQYGLGKKSFTHKRQQSQLLTTKYEYTE